MEDIFEKEFSGRQRGRRRSVAGPTQPGTSKSPKAAPELELGDLSGMGLDIDPAVLKQLEKSNRRGSVMPEVDQSIKEGSRFSKMVDTVSMPFDSDLMQKPVPAKKRRNSSFLEGSTRRLSHDSDPSTSKGGDGAPRGFESQLKKASRMSRASILFVGGASVPEVELNLNRAKGSKAGEDSKKDAMGDLVEILSKRHPFAVNPITLRFVSSHFEELYQKAVLESRHTAVRVVLILFVVTSFLVSSGMLISCAGDSAAVAVFMALIFITWLYSVALLILHVARGKSQWATTVCQAGVILGLIILLVLQAMTNRTCGVTLDDGIHTFDALMYDVLCWSCFVWIGLPFRFAWIGPALAAAIMIILEATVGRAPLDSWIYVVFKVALLNVTGAYFCYFSELENRRYIYTFSILIESTHIVKSESRRAEEIVKAQLPLSIMKNMLVLAEKRDAKDEKTAADTHVQFDVQTNEESGTDGDGDGAGAGMVTEREVLHEWMFNPPEYFKSMEVTSIVFVEWSNFNAEDFTPVEAAQILNEYFQALENIAQETGMDKIKTSGNLFMGMPEVDTPFMLHPHSACLFASRVMSRIEDLRSELQDGMTLRVGLATGPVVTGILGTVKWSYDVWGDTVNMASRMMSTAAPNECQADESTSLFVDGSMFTFTKRSNVYVKGKGKVDVFVLRTPSVDDITSHHLFQESSEHASDLADEDLGEDLVIEWKRPPGRERVNTSRKAPVTVRRMSSQMPDSARQVSQLSAPSTIVMGREGSPAPEPDCLTRWLARMMKKMRPHVTSKVPATPNVQLPYTLNRLTMRFTNGFENNYSIYSFSTSNNSALRLLFCAAVIFGYALMSGIMLEFDPEGCLVSARCYVTLWALPCFLGPATIFVLYLATVSIRWHNIGRIFVFLFILLATLTTIVFTEDTKAQYVIARTAITWTGSIPYLLRIRYPHVMVVYISAAVFLFAVQSSIGIAFRRPYATVVYLLVVQATLGYTTEALSRTLFMTNTLLLFEKKHIKQEQQRSVRFLNNLLPPRIVSRLFDEITSLRQFSETSIGRELHVESISSCSVIYTDIVGFTSFCNRNSAEVVVNHLHRLFALLDELAKAMGVEKVKTLGDCYVGIALNSDKGQHHAVRVIEFAFHVIAAINEYNRQYGTSFHMRTGIASGSALGVLIGQRKFVYDVIGETAAKAASLEQGSRVDGINLDDNTHQSLEPYAPIMPPKSLKDKSNEHLHLAVYEIYRKAQRNELARVFFLRPPKYPTPFVMLNGSIIVASQKRKKISDSQYIISNSGETVASQTKRRGLFRRINRKKSG